jgi:hypothetical protein
MTYRQKVRSVYPDAELWNGCDIIYCRVVSKGSNSRPDLYQRAWLSVNKHNPYEAWKDAWHNIQVMMIKKLEQR